MKKSKEKGVMEVGELILVIILIIILSSLVHMVMNQYGIGENIVNR